MDIVLVVLRLIHIASAFAWFGIGATLALFVVPAAASSGESGLRFLKNLLSHTAVSRAFPIAAGLTIVAGLLLYAVSGAPSHFSSTGNIVLGIGAVAGLAAGAHGGAVTGRVMGELRKALEQAVPEGGQTIAADAVSTLRAQAEKLTTDARISLVITVVALIAMGSARYL